MKMNMDEQSLIQQVQEGNLDAYSAVMELHIRRVRAFIALNTPVPHLVDEIAHGAFVFAYQHIQEFQRGTSFIAWLKSIAWNLLRAEVQRFSREQANQLKYGERRVLDAFGGRSPQPDSPELDLLKTCVENVTPRMRDLLAMRYSFAFSTKEIAERVDHSAAWVRTTLFRLRRHLKECVQKKLAAEKP